jgi:CxxC-x17-CxxC domain-containing protein
MEENMEEQETENKSSDDERKMHKATCSDCGCECEVPFEPTTGKPVYCKDCFMKRKPKRSFGGNNFGGNRRKMQMHKATCANCKADCEVPFKPTGEKPVLCRDCYAKSKE